MADEEEKPKINTDEKLTLRVRSQDGQQVTFQAKPTTKFSKLMRAYCERQMVDFDSVVFSYDGQRLREDQTPGELDMENDEFIDVLQHQVRFSPGCEDHAHFRAEQKSKIWQSEPNHQI